MKNILPLFSFLFWFSNSNAQLISETKIGETTFDIQENSSSYSHLFQSQDGTLSAVWTFSTAGTSGTSFPDRGTGYNYFDGSQWLSWPSSRIEQIYRGFPNIVTNRSGAEITVQHGSSSISVNYRPIKGTGVWSSTVPWATGIYDTWTKMAASGDSIYVLWNGSGSSGPAVHGQTGPILFSHSYDGGMTWSQQTIIHELDSTFYDGFSADAFSIDARGSTIAIVFGDPVVDLGIVKSNDGGNTWTKTIIKPFPIPHFATTNPMASDTNNDGVTDTLYTATGDHTILIDNDNMVHVWFTLFKLYFDASTSGSFHYFTDYDGLHYWNESYTTNDFKLIALPKDLNNNGTIDLPGGTSCYALSTGEYQGSKTGKPSAGIDDQGTIYLAYQTIDEAADTSLYHAAHIHSYLTTLPKTNGVYSHYNWTYPFDIAKPVADGGIGEYVETVYPFITRDVLQHAYVMYQRDSVPGTFNTPCNSPHVNDIMIAEIDPLSLSTKSVSANLNSFNVANNPTSSEATLQLAMNEASDLDITITNISGIQLEHFHFKNIPAGPWYKKLDLSKLADGYYLVTVVTDAGRASKGIVVSK